MHCNACAFNIDDALEALPGVVKARTSYRQSTTTVTYEPEKINPKLLFKTIKTAGYTPIPQT
jgi:copper chaperone CopZ